MKNNKKILSAITALTITASTFAGFAIPVNAAESSLFTYDFEDGAVWTAGGGNSGNYANKIVDDTTLGSKVYDISLTGSNTGGRNCNITIPEAKTASIVKLTFDWFSNTTIASCGTDFMIQDSNGNTIFMVSDLQNKVKVAGNETDLANGQWYNVEAIIDFTNKRVVSLKLLQSDEVKAEYKHIPFVSDAASDIGKIGIQSNRASGASMTGGAKFDDFNAYALTDEYFNVTMAVKDSNSNPVSDATITFDDTQFVTDDNGNVNVVVAPGEYSYSVDKDGYEATPGGNDKAEGTITVSSDNVTEDITFSPKTYTAVPTTVTMSGGQKAMTAPKTAESLTSKAFAVEVLDQENVPIEDADIEWSIAPADDFVTVENGIVTVLKGFTAGENHVKDFTVTATATKNEQSKLATATVAISDYLFYEPGLGGSSYGETEAHPFNTGGVDEAGDTYISTPTAKNGLSTITLPEAVTFVPGTAQKISFKTATTNKDTYTLRRQIQLVSSSDTSIIEMGYINKEMGDAATATWDSKGSSFTTIWGTVPALNTWTDVSILFKTTADGVTKGEITINDVTTDLGVIEADDLAKINLSTTMNSSDRYALFKDIIVEDVDVTGLSISGLKDISTVTDSDAKYNYSVDVMVSVDGETFTWDTTIPGATITPDEDDTTKAVLSVPAGATDGQITVTSSVSTAEAPKTASFDVNVEPAVITSIITGPKTVSYMENATYEYGITDIKDQFGNDISSFVNPVWSIEGTAVSEGEATFNITAEEASTVVVAKAVYSGDKLESLTTENRDLTVGENTITVNASNGTKVMIWNSLTDMKPLAEAKIAEGGTISEDAIATIDAQTGLMTVLKEGTPTILATITNGENKYRAEYDVVIGTFYAVADATGDSTVVDISGIVPNDKITGYQVTTATAEGVLVNKTVVNKADVVDNTITADTNGAAKVEVAPVYEGVIGDEFIVPAASYDITVVAGTADRTDVYVNDQMVINNLNQGSDNWSIGRIKVDDTEYVAGDVVINEGSAVFNLRDDKGGTGSAKKIKFVKTPSIVERKTRVYVIGDSLVAKYYGNAPEGSEGLVRTGWGQVLADYLTDDVNVTNLGNSGAWAEAMLNDAFTNVKASAQAGDILVLESGYNDSSHTSMEVMKASIRTMIREAEEKGMTVFVVTPNASSHSLNEYKGAVKSTSDVIAAVNDSNTMDGTNAILINLAAKSGEFFASYYGEADTTIPAVALEKLPLYYNNAADSLHSSYNAANCWAAIVANGILSNDSTADIVDTTHEYTFSDGTTDITVSATQIVNPDSVSE